MDLSAFDAPDYVDIMPHRQRILSDVDFCMIAPRGKGGPQMLISFASGVVSTLGDFVALRWWPTGHIRISRGTKHDLALRKLNNTASRHIRCTAPAGLIYPGKPVKMPAEWTRDGLDILIEVPRLFMGGVSAESAETLVVSGDIATGSPEDFGRPMTKDEFVDQLCADPEAEPVAEPVMRTLVHAGDALVFDGANSGSAVCANRKLEPEQLAEVPAVPVNAVKPESKPVKAAKAPARAKAAETAKPEAAKPAPAMPEPAKLAIAKKALLFMPVKLGAAYLREGDLPMLRDLAAGRDVTPASADDWRRVREQLRDAQVLLPIGGGKLTPQGRTVLSKLIKAHDARVMSEAAG